LLVNKHESFLNNDAHNHRYTNNNIFSERNRNTQNCFSFAQRLGFLLLYYIRSFT
jgi:hypothetical protein